MDNKYAESALQPQKNDGLKSLSVGYPAYQYTVSNPIHKSIHHKKSGANDLSVDDPMSSIKALISKSTRQNPIDKDDRKVKSNPL